MILKQSLKRNNLTNRLKPYGWTLKDMEGMTDRELSKQIAIEELKAQNVKIRRDWF